MRVGITCVILFCFALNAPRARADDGKAEEEKAAALEKLGARVQRDELDPKRAVIKVSISNINLNPGVIKNLMTSAQNS